MRVARALVLAAACLVAPTDSQQSKQQGECVEGDDTCDAAGYALTLTPTLTQTLTHPPTHTHPHMVTVTTHAVG